MQKMPDGGYSRNEIPWFELSRTFTHLNELDPYMFTEYSIDIETARRQLEEHNICTSEFWRGRTPEELEDIFGKLRLPLPGFYRKVSRPP